MKIIQYMRFSFECAGVWRAAGRIDARGAWPVTQGYVRHTKKSPGRAGGFFRIGWIEFYYAFSVVPQRFDGAHLGSLLRRVNAEDDADTSREEHSTDDGDRGEYRRESTNGTEDISADHAEYQTDEAADQGDDGGLGEELQQNGIGLGAQGFADTDFPGTLGYRYQHDVHNADTADHQGDGSHRRNEVGHQTHDIVDHIQLGAEILGVVDAASGIVVPGFQDAHSGITHGAVLALVVGDQVEA